jgi:N-methylhydantoinase B/oxoprolinase/acetone carboxylase alpha subunit
MTLGPITVEVIRNALIAAAAEMDVTIWRTSRSTIVRELLDYSTAVFDAEGNNVAQSARIPQHLNSMGAALRTLLDDFVPPEAWGPGDVVATNDPYCGAQHLNDILVFKAVFHGGRRIAFVGTLCHHIDMGGMAPGSYAATATEVFQEGLRLPPVKLIEGGKLNQQVWSIIGQNVRKPSLMLGDLQSQLASLDIGEAAIHRVAGRHSAEALEEAMARILDMSEAAMRATIRDMPDGTYEFEDFLDNDGLSEEPVRLHAKLTIAGDTIEVDLTGCADQQRGPINCTPAMSNCAVYYGVIAAADGAVPANAGCYRPIRIQHRAGSVTNCRAPASVAHRVAVTHRLANVMFGALHKAIPHRMPAAYYGGSYVMAFQTIGEDGHRDVLVEIEIGGTGGHPTKDGVNAYAFGMHNNANIPIEMIESQMPLTITSYGLVPDSSGDGQYRGGLGLFREWRVDSPVAMLSANMDRFRFPPYGLAGGRPARLGRLLLLRDGEEIPIPPKSDGVMLRKGDVVRLETSGGGGFGDPGLRSPAARRRDRMLGYVSD